MIKNKKIILVIVLILVIIGGIIYFVSQFIPSKPESVVRKNLDSFKNLDLDTIEEFVTYEDFFGISEIDQDIPAETLEVFQLFLEDFDFEIVKSIASSKEAIVKVNLTTIDAQAVVKDYYKTIILYAMSHPSTDLTTGTESESLYHYFALLRDVLIENEYETVTNTISIRLNKVNGKWKIILTKELEDSLFGGFVTYTNSSDLFTPEETVEMTLEQMKKLTPSQFIAYIGFNDIFSTKNELSDALDQATVEQILLYFDYKIVDSVTEGESATVTTEVTSLDLQYILAKYADSLITYASTSDAIHASEEEQSNAIAQLLLDAIINNTESTTSTIEISLYNDGTCWNIELNEAFADALVGELGNATNSFNEILEQKTAEN